MADEQNRGPNGEQLMCNVQHGVKVYAPKADAKRGFLGPREFFKDCTGGALERMIARGYVAPGPEKKPTMRTASGGDVPAAPSAGTAPGAGSLPS